MTYQQDTFDVFTPQLFDDFWRENSRCKCTTENGIEFLVQTTDSHLSEIPIRIDDRLANNFSVNLKY